MLSIWFWNLCPALVIYYSGWDTSVLATCLTFVRSKFDCELAEHAEGFRWDEDTRNHKCLIHDPKHQWYYPHITRIPAHSPASCIGASWDLLWTGVLQCRYCPARCWGTSGSCRCPALGAGTFLR